MIMFIVIHSLQLYPVNEQWLIQHNSYWFDRNFQVSSMFLVTVGCGLSWVYERAAGKFFFLRSSLQGYS